MPVLTLLAALAVQALERPDPRPVAPTAAWLAGVWITSATKDDLDRLACNSGTVTDYRRGGRLRVFEGEGRWMLRGRRLTETFTRRFETADGDFALNRPSNSRLVRVGPHEAVRVFADGHRDRMLRCRPGDIR